MNELQLFKNEEFGNLRGLIINNEPWFVGKDIAVILGYIKPTDAVRKHVDEEDRGISKMETPSGIQDMTVINESGLYSLILSSKLPNAKKFKRWVTSDVLPTIRKSGGYVLDERKFIDSYFPDADELTKEYMTNNLIQIKNKNAIIAKQKLEISEKNKTIDNQHNELIYKNNVIAGLVEDITLADKRQRINQIVRHGSDKNYSKRFGMLYKEFCRLYHIDLDRRMASEKTLSIIPKIKNKMDYIDRVLNMTQELYEVCCKLFESDIRDLVNEMYRLKGVSVVEVAQ